MTEPLARPKRQNPLKKTRVPLLPEGTRSRTALGLAAAAAEGRFQLQVCSDCAIVVYPPRDACPRCLSPRLPYRDVANGGTLLAETTIRTSTDVYFRERMPWRIGTVALDCGPSIVAHLHGDLREGERARLQFKLDKSGQAIAMALPAADTPNMADDPQWRELTSDPKYRRVLITDRRTAVGQALAEALSEVEASIILVGIADAWKPFPGEERLRKIERVEIVALDLTDTISVNECAAEYAPRIDILINTAEHVRTGGIIERKGLTIAREELEIRYLGLMRLAQVLRADPARARRGRDQFRRGLRQSPFGLRARELARLRRLLRDRGRLPFGGAVAPRRAPARRDQGFERVLRSARDRVVPGSAAAQGAARDPRQGGRARAAARPRGSLRR
jgi:uncharacterized OB-fold protein